MQPAAAAPNKKKREIRNLFCTLCVFSILFNSANHLRTRWQLSSQWTATLHADNPIPWPRLQKLWFTQSKSLSAAFSRFNRLASSPSSLLINLHKIRNHVLGEQSVVKPQTNVTCRHYWNDFERQFKLVGSSITELHCVTHHSIALAELYPKCFDSDCIGRSVRPPNSRVHFSWIRGQNFSSDRPVLKTKNVELFKSYRSMYIPFK